MPTRLHVPKALLAAFGRKARSLRISRNQLIIQAMEREVERGSEWSPGFFDQLEMVGPELGETVDCLLREIQKEQRTKRPPAK